MLLTVLWRVSWFSVVFFGLHPCISNSADLAGEYDQPIEFYFPENIKPQQFDIKLIVKGDFPTERIDLLDAGNAKKLERNIALRRIGLHLSANRKGELEEILKNWVESDVATMREKFSSAMFFDRNTKQMNALEKASYLFGFKYKEYLIIVVEHDFGSSNFRFHYTLKMERDNVFLTNELQDDLVLNSLTELLYDSSVRKSTD